MKLDATAIRQIYPNEEVPHFRTCTLQEWSAYSYLSPVEEAKMCLALGREERAFTIVQKMSQNYRATERDTARLLDRLEQEVNLLLAPGANEVGEPPWLVLTRVNLETSERENRCLVESIEIPPPRGNFFTRTGFLWGAGIAACVAVGCWVILKIYVLKKKNKIL